MKIKYHGHACFSITSNDYTIVIDPYCGVEGFKDVDLKANEVLTSHNHKDHCYIEGVKIDPKASPFKVEKISTFHDDVKGTLRGNNDIHVLEAEGKKVVHLGDLGHRLNNEQLTKIKNCDVLMIPVGGYYTIDTIQALSIVEDIEPKNVIPMHYRDNDKGYGVLSTSDEFVKKCRVNILLVKGYEKEVEI